MTGRQRAKKLGLLRGGGGEDVSVLSEHDLARVLGAGREPVSLRRALGCGLVVLSAALASTLAGTHPGGSSFWWAGGFATLTSLAGGFLVGYDLAADLGARLRDARVSGQAAALTQRGRLRVARAQPSGPPRHVAVLLLLVGVGAPAALWMLRALLGDASSACLWAVLLAGSAGLPGVQLGTLPWERCLAALRDGRLDERLRARQG